MERSHRDGCGGGDRRGFGDLLRSILSGVPWSERAEQTETRSLATPRGGALRVDNANGKTRVIGEDREDIEVSLRKVARAESPEGASALLDAIRLEARDEAGVLVLGFDIPGRWNRRGWVDVEVRAPRGLRVDVVAANGRVCVQGLRSAVRCKSSNGTIRIEDVVGDISVATSNAKVKTVCTCGRLRARSSNGKIELEEHRGSVDASTSNGMIHCDLDEVGSEGVVLSTSNGRISLDLPEQVDGDVDIRVDNGVIRTARDVTGASGEERRGRVKGTLGRGGVPIRLRASNGTISLR
jgi:hypothetical protein